MKRSSKLLAIASLLVILSSAYVAISQVVMPLITLRKPHPKVKELEDRVILLEAEVATYTQDIADLKQAVVLLLQLEADWFKQFRAAQTGDVFQRIMGGGHIWSEQDTTDLEDQITILETYQANLSD